MGVDREEEIPQAISCQVITCLSKMAEIEN